MHVRAQLEAAYEHVRRASTNAFSPQQRRRRAALVEELRRYIDAGRYPINDVALDATPIFVDRRGHRCAVAALLEATGRHVLVERIAARRNLDRVHDLASEPGLAEWLDEHGLRLDEAARIQPAYHAHLAAEWAPTVSVVAGAHAGGTEDAGAEAVLTVGARAGIRRNVRGSDDSGSSRYGSTALTVEYARVAIPGRGGTNQLGFTFQWEPLVNSRDVQWYVIGGPLASVDSDVRPGSGFGGQLGTGASFRRRELPLFGEIVVQSLPVGDVPTLRAGLQVGVVF